MRKATLSLVIGAVVASGAACAGEDQGTQSQLGGESSFGANTSTELSVDSIEQVGASSAFAKLDADGNGKVSSQEADDMEGLNDRFATLDSDGDGALSFDEFAALAANIQGSDDLTGQSSAMINASQEAGVVLTAAGTEGSDDSGWAAETETETEIGSEYGDTGMESEFGMETEGDVALKVEGITESNVKQTFKTVDANGDETVDSTEATAVTGLSNVFAQLDANGDGALDYTEFQAVTSLSGTFGGDQS